MSEVKTRDYVIFQVPGQKNGKKVDMAALCNFINDRDAIGYEFVSFLPSASGVSKHVLFKKKPGEW